MSTGGGNQNIRHDIRLLPVMVVGVEGNQNLRFPPGVLDGVRHAGGNAEPEGLIRGYVEILEGVCIPDAHEGRPHDGNGLGSLPVVVISADCPWKGDHDVGVSLDGKLRCFHRFENEAAIVGMNRQWINMNSHKENLCSVIAVVIT